MALLPPAIRPHLLECQDCGVIQRLPIMPPNARAACPRCDAHLRHTRTDPFGPPLALNLAALMMFTVGASLHPAVGQHRRPISYRRPADRSDQLRTFGLWELSMVVLITTFAAPLGRILCMIFVLAGLRLPHRPPGIRMAFAWVEHLRPWSMVEIFLLGLFVAYVRLSDIAHIDLGPAILALGTLSLTVLLSDIFLDQHAVWAALDAQRPFHDDHPPSASLLGARLHLMGCDTCRLVSHGRDGALCPRCGFALHHRKPNSLTHTWALVIASLILYIPANTYPVLTVIRFGAGEPSTILQGVRELMEVGEWPLALLVFFASVAVPVLKIVSLILLLVTTMAGFGKHRNDRVVLVSSRRRRWPLVDDRHLHGVDPGRSRSVRCRRDHHPRTGRDRLRHRRDPYHVCRARFRSPG